MLNIKFVRLVVYLGCVLAFVSVYEWIKYIAIICVYISWTLVDIQIVKDHIYGRHTPVKIKKMVCSFRKLYGNGVIFQEQVWFYVSSDISAI